MQHARFLGGLLVVLALAACGGSGTDVATPVDNTADDTTDTAPNGAEPAVAAPTNLVVVRFDRNGDTHPDVLTLDVEQEPFRIVEALEGTAEGKAVDATGRLAGEHVDPAIAEALARHLAETFALGEETDLEVMVADRSVGLTVIE